MRTTIEGTRLPVPAFAAALVSSTILLFLVLLATLEWLRPPRRD